MTEEKRAELALQFAKLREAHSKASEAVSRLEERAAELEESGTEADVNGDLQQTQASLEILKDQMQASGTPHFHCLSGVSPTALPTIPSPTITHLPPPPTIPPPPSNRLPLPASSFNLIRPSAPFSVLASLALPYLSYLRYPSSRLA